MKKEETDDKKQPGKTGNIINIAQAQGEGLLDRKLKESVKQTIHGFAYAKADMLCGTKRYEHSPDRVDTRAGHKFTHTKAGKMDLKVPKLCNPPFETQNIVVPCLLQKHFATRQTSFFRQPLRLLSLIVVGSGLQSGDAGELDFKRLSATSIRTNLLSGNSPPLVRPSKSKKPSTSGKPPFQRHCPHNY